MRNANFEGAKRPMKKFGPQACAAVSAIALAVASHAALAQQNAEKIRFNIEAQPLSSAIVELSAQGGTAVLAQGNILDGIDAPAIEGVMTAEEALVRLIAGGGLVYEVTPSDTLIVRRPEDVAGSAEGASNHVKPSPLQLAQIATAPQRQKGTDGPNDMQLASADLDDGGDEELYMEQMVVTGTLIRGAAPAGSPVFVIDRQEIDRTGLSTVQDVVRVLPQNFGGGPNDITTGSPGSRNNSNINTGRGSGVNLRGLGTESTLTVVNGRRSTTNSDGTFVDISLIPLVAVERIEVLADGASAIYGSDAVAGVVNVILRDDYEGAETRLRYGTVTDGGQEEFQASQAFGKSWGAGNAIVAYEYYNRDALLSERRDFASSNDLTAFGGNDFRRTFTNPGTLVAGGQTFAIPEGQDGTALTPGQLVAGTVNFGNAREGTTMLPDRERHAVFAALSQKLLDRVEIFVEGRYASRDVTDLNQAEEITLTVPEDNPFFVDPVGGLTSVDIQYSLIGDVGPRRVDRNVNAYAVVGGTRVDLTETWQAEIYGSYSRQKDQLLSNEVNRLFLDEALGNFSGPVNGSLDNPSTSFNPLVDGFFNPFGDGSDNTPAVLQAIDGFFGRTAVAEQWLVNATADGVLFDGPGGEVKLALGVEYREWSSKNSITDFTATAEPDVQTPEFLDREIFAAFGQLFLPIFGESNGRPGLERLEVSVAGRFEDYSDFGTTANPKVGVVWSPFSGLNVRGSYGTSFRAPNLELFDETFNAPFFFGLSDPSAPDGNTDTIFLLGNNADIGPERARTWTAGLDFAPEAVSGLNIELTYFDIKYEDRIGSAIDFFFTVFEDENLFSPIITRASDISLARARDLLNDPGLINLVGSNDPNDVEAIVDLRTTNLAITRVRGTDALISYNFDSPIGSFNISSNFSVFFDFREAFTSAAPLIEVIDTVGKPVDWRMRNSVTWSNWDLSASAFVNYTDNYVDTDSSPNRKIDSYTTVDIRVAYDTKDRLSDVWLNNTVFSITVLNLFDEDPPFFNNFFGTGFDPEKASPQGRFISFQLTKQW